MSKHVIEQDWQTQLRHWARPFLECLNNQFQRTMAQIYLQGLWAPIERKSIEPMARQVAPGRDQSLHHFLTTSPWDEDCLLEQLAHKADQLVGGEDAVLVVDDTAQRKQGTACRAS